jgi:hypothetical protein
MSHQQSPVQLACLEKIRKRLLRKRRTVRDTLRTVPVPWVGQRGGLAGSNRVSLYQGFTLPVCRSDGLRRERSSEKIDGWP